MNQRKREIIIRGIALGIALATQSGSWSAFTHYGVTYSPAVGHLAEQGSSDSYVTAWTYARYYGGAYYGGGPNRKSLAVTEGEFNGGGWDVREVFDNRSAAVTYVSTGSLWDSTDFGYVQSWVDTDVDVSTDPLFNPAVGELEAWAVVLTQ
jgi:hypothetical protein